MMKKLTRLTPHSFVLIFPVNNWSLTNYMAELCGQAFKAAWFIKATLRNG